MAQLTAIRDRLDPAELRERLAAQTRTTPGRLRLSLIVLIVLGTLTGLAAVIGAVQRESAVNAVANSSGPLAVQAQALYRSLSDADATAANAFLTSVPEPPDARQRYLDDIAAASTALASTMVASDADRATVARITTGLPVYTGLIETARANNLQYWPVGAAYLREASNLMQNTLLPAAADLYRGATERLAADRSDADEFPWVTIPLLLLTLAALVASQRYLTRRTQRLVNPGLASATAAALILLLWVGASWIAVASHLGTGHRDGSAQVEAAVQIRITALQARTDEALTLVARGSGGDFEATFKDRMNQLVGADGQSGLLATAIDQADQSTVHSALQSARDHLLTWRKTHQSVRAMDDSGDYPGALKLAVGDSAAQFGQVDGDLQQAITAAGAVFDDEANGADNAMTLSVVGWLVFTIVMVAGLVVGLEQRIAEYR